jgi:methyltransferase (TIGR00027 family)
MISRALCYHRRAVLMPASHASATAMGVALVRALESRRPSGKRVCDDPFARRFVPAGLLGAASIADGLGLIERLYPGVLGFLVTRERHIDEYLATAIAGGATQVVILGAGYDSRAHRCEVLQEGVRVFEVDHAATQQAKIEKVRAIFGALPAHVTYVSIDLGAETLDSALGECGYDTRSKTLFIWQGVTHYLTPVAVDRTLAYVADRAAPGSSIIFDYMYTSLLDGSNPRPEVARVQRSRWLKNERLTFGIRKGTIHGFLEDRGFTDVRNADADDLHRSYLGGANHLRRVADGYAIVSAVVENHADAVHGRARPHAGTSSADGQRIAQHAGVPARSDRFSPDRDREPR